MLTHKRKHRLKICATQRKRVWVCVRACVRCSHQRSLVCVRVFEVDDLQDQTLLGFGHVGLTRSLKERVTLKLIWRRKKTGLKPRRGPF